MRYTLEFKDEAVRQIIDRRHTVAEASKRSGVSEHGLYKWVKAVKPKKREEQATELVETKNVILELRAQLRHADEEHDILKTM